MGRRADNVRVIFQQPSTPSPLPFEVRLLKHLLPFLLGSLGSRAPFVSQSVGLSPPSLSRSVLLSRRLSFLFFLTLKEREDKDFSCVGRGRDWKQGGATMCSLNSKAKNSAHSTFFLEKRENAFDPDYYTYVRICMSWYFEEMKNEIS